MMKARRKKKTAVSPTSTANGGKRTQASVRSTCLWVGLFLAELVVLFQHRRLSRLYSGWNDFDKVPISNELTTTAASTVRTVDREPAVPLMQRYDDDDGVEDEDDEEEQQIHLKGSKKHQQPQPRSRKDAKRKIGKGQKSRKGARKGARKQPESPPKSQPLQPPKMTETISLPESRSETMRATNTAATTAAAATTFTARRTRQAKYAYAFVMAGVDPDVPRGHRAILYSILVNAHILESAGSTADIVVLVQMSPSTRWKALAPEDVKRFQAYPSIVLHYIPTPHEAPTFYASQFDKFHILELTQYRRILYLDADVMPLCSWDYLFDMSDEGVLKENMLLAGNNEPSNGGFMMVKPGEGEYEHVLRIIEERDTYLLRHSPNLTFDEEWGWGHVIQPPDYWRTRYNRKRGTTWNFTTVYGNQGLMYHWAKYVKQSVSLFAGNEVENWGPSNDTNTRGPVLEGILVDALQGHECPTRKQYPMDKDVKAPYDMEGQMWHFDGKFGKPWMVSGLSDKLKGNKTDYFPFQTWVGVFDQVQQRLNTTFHVQRDLRTNPTLGSWTKRDDFRRSLERKYAYAFLLAGVDPAKPKGYRGFVFAILVSAQALEEAGSTADIVVMVQMSHETELDVLPEQDLKFFKAYPSIVIHYLQKPARAPEYYSLQFEKFHILELTQYRRVLYLDADVTPICNLDYLFRLSEQGVLKDNMVIAGISEPSNGGFVMLRPGVGEYEQLVKIIEERDGRILTTSPNLTFDEVVGWGHVIQPPDYWRTRYNMQRGTLWNFTTVFGNQGLIYHWIKYVKKSASLFIGNEVENWIGWENDTEPVLEGTIVDPIKGYECPTRMDFKYIFGDDDVAKPPYDLEGQIMHFWGKYGKPWMMDNPYKTMNSNDTRAHSLQVWFQHLDKVKQRLNITLNLANDLRHDPALGSWTTTIAFKRSLAKRHAYAFVLGGVDPKRKPAYAGVLFSILVNAHILESWGSMADIVVLVQMSYQSETYVLPDEDLKYLKAYPSIVIHYLPKPTGPPSFYAAQFDKFYILELTQYRRILYLDADVMPLCNLDYLFHFSERGIFKDNMIIAGNNEPSNGGFMMLRPEKGDYQKVRQIIDERDARMLATPNLTFDVVLGWGHVIKPPDYWRTRYNRKRGTFWNFTTAFGNQGLMFYWVKYVKKSASIFLGNEVENWGPPADPNETTPVLEATLVDALKGHECNCTILFTRDKYSKPPYDLEGQMRHFDGKYGKPWMVQNLTHKLRSTDASHLAIRMWYQALDQVKRRLDITLDVQKELRHDPALGSWTTTGDLTASLLKKHAYAFVLAGVNPENRKGYRAFLFSILVNAQILESWGSTADIVVLVQMSYDTDADALPDEELKYLKAYPRIVIHYLPKPTERPTFYSSQFDKFYILELTQYRRVLFLDADVMPLCNLDYLFLLSEQGVFKENMILAGNNEPSNGGFLMLRPAPGDYQKVLQIIDERDARIRASPNMTFDEVFGWGHVIQPPDHWRTRYNRRRGTFWNFTTAFGNQGLMFYWVKYVKKSFSIFLGNEVENWGPPLDPNDTTPVLEETLVDALKGHECPSTKLFIRDKDSKPPYDLEGQMRHFDGKFGKPWMVQNLTEKLRSKDDATYLGIQMWYEALDKVKKRLNIEIDVNRDLRHDPAIGSWTLAGDFKNSITKKAG